MLQNKAYVYNDDASQFPIFQFSGPITKQPRKMRRCFLLPQSFSSMDSRILLQ